MIAQLKSEVCRANLQLVNSGLVVQTWGNVSGVDRKRGLMVIKPSGVPYQALVPGQMVVVSLETGKVVESDLNPSSDTPTHLELYRAFPQVGGVVHTHSLYATAWAQARRPLPCYGTTHADYWHGEVPCTRLLTPEETRNEYEANTGRVIMETFRQLNPTDTPGVLVAGHGPFAWGADAPDALHNAVVLEFIAHLASETLAINPQAKKLPTVTLHKHFLRKHGAGATYGQRK
jgi:L-ribulose-5-phosphate 4-epimerase